MKFANLEAITKMFKHLGYEWYGEIITGKKTIKLSDEKIKNKICISENFKFYLMDKEATQLFYIDDFEFSEIDTQIIADNELFVWPNIVHQTTKHKNEYIKQVQLRFKRVEKEIKIKSQKLIERKKSEITNLKQFETFSKNEKQRLQKEIKILRRKNPFSDDLIKNA